ncbi:MAG TPA: hypothetical protein VGS22_21765 [Thermoanaerobaculia bacterium]|nr:hypothetical protein [Thermoanaerobaculia bacterium]
MSRTEWLVGQEANKRSAEALDFAKQQFGILQSDADDATLEEQGRFERQLTASKDQAEASRKQSAADAVASLGLARESLEASRKGLEYSQRAQLGAVEIDDFPLTKPLPARLRVTLQNTGRGVASDVLVKQSLVPSLSSSAPDVESELAKWQAGATQSRAAVPAGANYYAFFDVDDSKMFADVPDRDEAMKRLRWFVVGKVTYFDGFRQRSTKFFWVHAGGTSQTWRACESGNSAD